MMNKQRGVGLSEVMICLLLSSLIMIALMNHYLSVKRHYLHLQSVMDDAMELQFVMDFMRDSIRQAGFTPCLSLNHLITLDRRDAHPSISAIEVGSELNIHRMSPYFNVILNGENSTRILITRDNVIHDDRPLLLADCYHAEVQRVVSVSQTNDGQLVTLANPPAFTYHQPVYVGEWVHERFFIRPNKGLFYERVNTDELTPLVKNMSLVLNANRVLVKLALNNEQQLELEARVRA